MDYLKLQALRNAFRVVERLKRGETISREALIDALREPLPPAPGLESEAVILHAYRYYVINRGVKSANQVVTYEEAAVLSGKSVEAIRQAAYRGTLVKMTEYRDGRTRAGVVAKSLSDWCGWTSQKFEDAMSKVNEGLRWNYPKQESPNG